MLRNIVTEMNFVTKRKCASFARQDEGDKVRLVDDNVSAIPLKISLAIEAEDLEQSFNISEP